MSFPSRTLSYFLSIILVTTSFASAQEQILSQRMKFPDDPFVTTVSAIHPDVSGTTLMTVTVVSSVSVKFPKDPFIQETSIASSQKPISSQSLQFPKDPFIQEKSSQLSPSITASPPEITIAATSIITTEGYIPTGPVILLPITSSENATPQSTELSIPSTTTTVKGVTPTVYFFAPAKSSSVTITTDLPTSVSNPEPLPTTSTTINVVTPTVYFFAPPNPSANSSTPLPNTTTPPSTTSTPNPTIFTYTYNLPSILNAAQVTITTDAPTQPTHLAITAAANQLPGTYYGPTSAWSFSYVLDIPSQFGGGEMTISSESRAAMRSMTIDLIVEVKSLS